MKEFQVDKIPEIIEQQIQKELEILGDDYIKNTKIIFFYKYKNKNQKIYQRIKKEK